jgi:hypothetical protein
MTPFILNLGIKRRWAVDAPAVNPGTHRMRGWRGGPRADLDDLEERMICFPYRDSNPGLRYPGSPKLVGRAECTGYVIKFNFRRVRKTGHVEYRTPQLIRQLARFQTVTSRIQYQTITISAGCWVRLQWHWMLTYFFVFGKSWVQVAAYRPATFFRDLTAQITLL